MSGIGEFDPHVYHPHFSVSKPDQFFSLRRARFLSLLPQVLHVTIMRAHAGYT